MAQGLKAELFKVGDEVTCHDPAYPIGPMRGKITCIDSSGDSFMGGLAISDDEDVSGRPERIDWYYYPSEVAHLHTPIKVCGQSDRGNRYCGTLTLRQTQHGRLTLIMTDHPNEGQGRYVQTASLVREPEPVVVPEPTPDCERAVIGTYVSGRTCLAGTSVSGMVVEIDETGYRRWGHTSDGNSMLAARLSVDTPRGRRWLQNSSIVIEEAEPVINVASHTTPVMLDGWAAHNPTTGDTGTVYGTIREAVLDAMRSGDTVVSVMSDGTTYPLNSALVEDAVGRA